MDGAPGAAKRHFVFLLTLPVVTLVCSSSERVTVSARAALKIRPEYENLRGDSAKAA